VLMNNVSPRPSHHDSQSTGSDVEHQASKPRPDFNRGGCIVTSQSSLTYRISKTVVYLLTVVIALVVGPVVDAWSAEVLVRTIPHARADYYEWITSLSEGPTYSLLVDELAEIQARIFRVVVLTSEIYNTVYIEEITTGREGCCRRLKSIRKLDLEDWAQQFKMKGELAGFRIVRWSTPTTAEVEFQGRAFVLTDLDRARVRVSAAGER